MPTPKQTKAEWQARNARRNAILFTVAAPNPQHVLKFSPNDQGELKHCSRLEAQDKGQIVYTGDPCSMSKVHKLQDGGGWCSIRYVKNGCSTGQLKFQSKHKLSTTTE